MIYIESDVWVGQGMLIMDGITIKENPMVGKRFYMGLEHADDFEDIHKFLNCVKK